MYKPLLILKETLQMFSPPDASSPYVEGATLLGLGLSAGLPLPVFLVYFLFGSSLSVNQAVFLTVPRHD